MAVLASSGSAKVSPILTPPTLSTRGPSLSIGGAGGGSSWLRVAYTGPEGVKSAHEWLPDVILCDIGLPGMDGYEVVGRLRRLPQLERTLMVALTGFGQESDRLRALAAGFDEHLVKPVDLDTVHGVLRRRLGTA